MEIAWSINGFLIMFSLGAALLFIISMLVPKAKTGTYVLLLFIAVLLVNKMESNAKQLGQLIQEFALPREKFIGAIAVGPAVLIALAGPILYLILSIKKDKTYLR